MAKTTKAEAVKVITVENWSDIDLALANMSQIEAKRIAIKAKYDPEITRLQAERDASLAPLDECFAANEKQIQEYLLSHPEEFGEKKTLKFPHGSVAIRTSEQVKYANDDVQATAAKLQELGLKDCFKAALKPVVSALKRLNPEVLILAGVSFVKSLSITVKPLGKD